jgi:hypothetical protein
MLDGTQSITHVVQLSPRSPASNVVESTEKTATGPVSTVSIHEIDKSMSNQVKSPPCVILDDDSSPSPSVEKKSSRQASTTPVKRSQDTDKTNSKSIKQTRESDKSVSKEKSYDNNEIKRKRQVDGLLCISISNDEYLWIV